MITLGPFRISELDKLKGIMESRGAVHEFFADEELRDRQTEEFNANATMSPRQNAGRLDLRYLFIELNEGEFEKVAADFEKLGIMRPSDGSWELSEDEGGQ